jgi:hypothetical protein
MITGCTPGLQNIGLKGWQTGQGQQISLKQKCKGQDHGKGNAGV